MPVGRKRGRKHAAGMPDAAPPLRCWSTKCLSSVQGGRSAHFIGSDWTLRGLAAAGLQKRIFPSLARGALRARIAQVIEI